MMWLSSAFFLLRKKKRTSERCSAACGANARASSGFFAKQKNARLLVVAWLFAGSSVAFRRKTRGTS